MNNELKEMLQSVLKEELDPIKEELQGVKSEMSSMNARMSTMETGMSSIEAKMEQGFKEINDKLSFIEAQTALKTKLQSPIYDFQRQVKDHDLDIKFIKRILAN